MALAKMPCIYSCSGFCGRTKTSWAESSLTRDSGFPISDDAGTSSSSGATVFLSGDVTPSSSDTRHRHGAATTEGIDDEFSRLGQPFHEVLELLDSLAHRVMLLVVGAGYQILKELTRRRGHHRRLGEYQHRLKCAQHLPSHDSSAADDGLRSDCTQPVVFEVFRHLQDHPVQEHLAAHHGAQATGLQLSFGQFCQPAEIGRASCRERV